MTLATLHNDISAVIARGSSQDSKIPRWVRQANLWLEQNYTFQHMRQGGEVWLDPQAQVPNALDLPNTRVKSITLVQPWTITNGGKMYANPLPKARRENVLSIDRGLPSGWWQLGNKLFFDALPQVRVDFDIAYAEFTSWPTSPDAQPVMLDRYENLLMAQALINAWVELKDPAAKADWVDRRNEALTAVLVAEEELEWTGQDLQMQPS